MPTAVLHGCMMNALRQDGSVFTYFSKLHGTHTWSSQRGASRLIMAWMNCQSHSRQ